jgi:uncharacterized membrane protein
MAESQAALSLDGQRHMALAATAEAAAIAWIRATSPRDAIVVEAAAVRCGDGSVACSDWTDVGRIASSTGRPTVLGWEQHELQWREPSPITGRRDDVHLLYSTGDTTVARDLLRRYDVRFVVVGPRERASYGVEGTAKWASLGTRVFSAGEGSVGQVDIYDVGGTL